MRVTLETIRYKIRKQFSGQYRVDIGSAWFVIARNESDGWYLGARNDAAFKAIGEPNYAPNFDTKREALEFLLGSVNMNYITE